MENVVKWGKCKYESCEYTASNKYSLSRHITEVHEGKKPFKCDTCDYSCYRKSLLTRHIQSLHDNKNHFKGENYKYYKETFEPTYHLNVNFVAIIFQKIVQRINIFNQFMKERNHSSVIFVTTALLEKATWMYTFQEFMKERSRLNVKFVGLSAPWRIL